MEWQEEVERGHLEVMKQRRWMDSHSLHPFLVSSPLPLLHDPACVSQHVLQGLTIQDYFICVYHKEEACVDTLFVFQDKT